MSSNNTTPKVLIIFFSLSGQSRGLINLFASGLKEQGINVTIEQIQAEKRISFPLKGIIRTMTMMLTTFLRWRVPIKELAPHCFDRYDLIVLAGPTWSYNPSGAMLSLLDRDGNKLMPASRVLPFISCRGYYRIHDFFLRRQLEKLGARLEDSVIFSHPVKEPWSTIGVFLKSAGLKPEKRSFLKPFYRHFGHTKPQLEQARKLGVAVGKALKKGTPPGSIEVSEYCK